MSIPQALRSELGEARECFEARIYTATVVMVRRALEGFCIDQGAKQRVPLQRQLAELSEAGRIDQRLLEWANGLRVLGNTAAHFTGTRVASVDAKDALDLAEAVFDYVYVFTAKFDEFKQRLESSGGRNASRAAVPAQEASQHTELIRATGSHDETTSAS
jgi:hypothetical protein